MRERTVRWEDPAPTLDLVATRAGVEVLRAMKTGTIAPPPVAMLVGFGFEEVEVGKVVMSLVPEEVEPSNMQGARLRSREAPCTTPKESC